MKKSALVLGLAATLFVIETAKAEDILLTCQYTYQDGNGVKKTLTNDPLWTLDINERRVLYNGKPERLDFLEISPRYITYGTNGFTMNNGQAISGIIHKIDRESGVFTYEFGPNFMSGSCRKASSSPRF